MEELVNVAVEEVAVEGSSGCSVSELWRLLEAKLPLPSGHVTALTDTVKQYIWVSLLQQRPLDILLYLPSGTSPHEPRPATKGKKKDSQQAQEELQETCPFESVPHYKDAEERGVRIKASTLARNNVLGLYDAHTSRFQLSGPQIMTLETIARARHLGALQSNLASKMNITNANFFYVVKCLEERGLIARTPVLLTTQRTARSNGVLTTNVLHLTRYAPPVRLGPSQVFKMVEVQGHHQQLDADTATYTIQDESRFMRLVSERIASTVGKAVIESELKIVLGFTGKKGHRYWRRIKGKLLKNGNIHVYVAEMNGKAVTCVKLLKEYTGPAEEGEGDGDEGEAEAINNGSLLVEVPLERQMLEAVLDAGHDGILTMHIFERLHLMAKKYVPALNELVKKYGLQVIPQHVGRVMQNRILAPPHLLEQYQHAQYTAFGVVPTQRASLPSQQQQGVPGEAEMHGGGEGAAEAPGTAGVGDAGPSSSMGGLQASVVGLGEAQASGPRAQTPLPQRASPAAAGAAGPSSVSEGVHAASASGAGERTTEGEGAGAGPATGQPAKRWAMRTTDLSDNRVRRLLARLEEQGFLVRHEIRAMLYNFEVANGLVPPSTSVYSKGPDKKTIERLIVRMEKANKAKRLSIAVPGSYQQGEARLTEVIVPFEPEVTDEKIKTMQDYFIMYERNLRQSSSNKYFLEKNQALRSITERQQQQTQRQQEGGKKIDHSDTQVAAEGGSPAPQLGQPSQQQHQQQQPSRPQAEQQGMVERVEAVARMGVGVHRMQDGKVVPLTGEERITRLLPPGSSLHGIRASLLAQGKTQRALQPAGSTFSFTPQRQLLPGVNASISGTRMAVQDQQALISGSSYQGERSTVRMTLNGYSWARQARVRLLHSFLCAFTGMCEPRQPPAPQQQQQQQLQQQHQQGQLQQQEDRTQGHAAAASVAEGEEVVTAARPPAVPAVPPPQDTQDQQSLFRPSTPKMSTEVFLSEGLEVGWQLRHLCAAAEPAQPLPEWKDMSGTQYGVTLELKQLEQRNRLVLTGDLQAAPIAAASGPRARTPPQEQQKQQRQQQQQQQQAALLGRVLQQPQQQLGGGGVGGVPPPPPRPGMQPHILSPHLTSSPAPSTPLGATSLPGMGAAPHLPSMNVPPFLAGGPHGPAGGAAFVPPHVGPPPPFGPPLPVQQQLQQQQQQQQQQQMQCLHVCHACL
uniref:B-block binding subunit of TFIIIC domain-containing protein n=1 Tax=Dunaliella tertiolecta TaxID=3047 RepID=A0A7S3VKM4_DUNTE